MGSSGATEACGSAHDEPWQAFWGQRQASPHDVYPNSPRIPMRLLSGEGGDPVLEVGCGSARDSVRLAQAGRQVVVLDRAPNALAIARTFAREAGVRLCLVRGDARQLPFRAGAFGTLFHQGVLEHFRDPLPLLRENHRVLRAGGTLLVDVPQTLHPWTLLKHILIPLGLWFGGWETQFTPGRIRCVVSQAGFTVRHIYGEWMDPSLVYRLIRELGRRTGLWRLPLYPRGVRPVVLARTVDRMLLKGAAELHTGYVVGAVAVRMP
ncbi:class I SAM-dependent methyltransferase [Candidatus Fermentibacteria bacterium]|nr:class I SAM-dependent methyltransferase [Candidatus Fermentibacteria bacterium]